MAAYKCVSSSFKKRFAFFYWPWVSLELPETVCSCSEIASFPTWIPPLSAGGGLSGGCLFHCVSKRSVPVLKDKPKTMFYRAEDIVRDQLSHKWFSRLGLVLCARLHINFFHCFLPSLLNILKWWLCQLFLLLIFWQMIAPWCQLNPANKK